MKRKIAVTAILGIFALMLINTTFAQPAIQLWIRTDKAYYEYGDEGTLYVAIHNKGPGPIEIKSIKVTFPWHGWYHGTWDGNFTKEITDGALGENDNKTYTFNFKVPSESRNSWTSNKAKIEVKYLYGLVTDTVDSEIWINMAIPVYNEDVMPIYYMTAALTIAVIIVIIELYFVWKRLRKLTLAPTTA